MYELLEQNWLVAVVWCWLFGMSISRQSNDNPTVFNFLKNIILSVLSATVLLGVGYGLWLGVIWVADNYL